MATKLQLYNSALRHLKNNSRLSSLGENRPARLILDDVWNSGAVDFCLSQAYWKFATRTVKLEASPSITPAFGHAYAFESPSDHLVTVALTTDEYLNNPLLDYSFEQGYWYSSVDEIYLQYVSNGDTYGGDLIKWSVNFTAYVELYLAYQACGNIEASDSAFKLIAARLKNALSKAKSTDAMEGPTKFLPPGQWTRSRSSGGGRSDDRGNRGRLIG